MFPISLQLSKSLMTLSVLVCEDKSKGVATAHALDIDILCQASTVEAALKKLAVAIKTYIEYGIVNGWNQDVLFPAPMEYWNRVAKAKPMGAFTIEIEKTPLFFHAILDESRQVTCAT